MGGATFHAFAERDRFPDGLKGTVRNGTRYLEQAYTAWPDAQTAMEIMGEQDRYENGHMSPDNVGGKHDLVHIDTVDDDDAAMALASAMIMAGDPRIRDKRGPAGCITIRGGRHAYLFFGWVAT